MRSPSRSTDARCFQQTCLSPHCWHRVVKSCLHGALRSRKTDKLVSKRTTKSPNKEPFVRRLLSSGVSVGKRHSFSGAWSTLEGWMRIYLAPACFFVSQSCVFSHYLIGIPALQTTHPLCALAFFFFSLNNAFFHTPVRKQREARQKNGRVYVKKICNASTPGPVKDMWQEVRTRTLEAIQESVNKWLCVSVDVYSAWKPFCSFFFFFLLFLCSRGTKVQPKAWR